jgi:hypothetical protein
LIPSLRRWFNERYTPEKYARFLALLEKQIGVAPEFRLNETPCFLPRELIDQMAQCGSEIVHSLLADPHYRKASDSAIPAKYNAPNEGARPLFIQADFGLDMKRQPKLVEIQGFPSLYAFQPVLAECYRDAYGIDLPYLPGLTSDEYHRILRRAILGDCDPENVILMEVDPANQKTLPDFLMTERLCGIKTVDIRDVKKRGNQLYYGNDVPIKRIYNRAIVDELERRNIALQFDFRDDLDVQWAGHPNWFFRLSKFSMPYMRHPSVPRTRFLDQAGDIEHPERYVLKPLFSFAGSGVVVGPTREDIDKVPAYLRHRYILQERIEFAPVIHTPAGATKIEVRIMYIWLDELLPVNTIIRTGRGAQMGVDHNKEFEWVGASAAFLADPAPLN